MRNGDSESGPDLLPLPPSRHYVLPNRVASHTPKIVGCQHFFSVPLQIPATTRRWPFIRLFLDWAQLHRGRTTTSCAFFALFSVPFTYCTRSSALYATYPSQSTTPCSLASLSVLSFHLLFIDSLNAVHPSPFVQNFRRLSVTSPSSAIPPSPPPPQYRCNWLSYPSNRSFSWPKAHALCSSLPLALYTQLVSSSTHA